MYLYNEGACLEQGILWSLLWETRSGQIWESIPNIFYVHLSSVVEKLWREHEPFLLPSFIYSLVKDLGKITVSGHMSTTGKVVFKTRMEVEHFGLRNEGSGTCPRYTRGDGDTKFLQSCICTSKILLCWIYPATTAKWSLIQILLSSVWWIWKIWHLPHLCLCHANSWLCR